MDPLADDAVELVLHGEDAPSPRRIVRLLLSGVVLELEGPALTRGQLALADLYLGASPQPLSVVGRVALLGPGDGPDAYRAGLEFVGTWQSLLGLRTAVATYLGSRVRAGDAVVGYVVPEGPGSSTCYDANTGMLAVCGRSEGRYVVRGRSGVHTCGSASEAVEWAFGLEARAELDPPLEPTDELEPAAPAAPDSEEEAVFGAQTIVLMHAPLSEVEILGAQTLVLREPAPPPNQEAILGAHTMLVGERAPRPRARLKRSKVYLGPLLVGLVVPSGDGCWSVQDDDEDEVGRVLLEGGRLTIVPLSGDTSRPASCWNQALQTLLELEREPTAVAPPLPEA